MIVRHSRALSSLLSYSSTRQLSTTPLLLANRHSRSRPPVRATPRRHPLTSAESPTASLDHAVIPTESPPLPPASRIPVHVPHDPQGILDLTAPSSPSSATGIHALLSNSAIVVARQIEMMSILVGYEQANKYQLLSPTGELLGYLMEEDVGIKGALVRQALRTHRPFKATVLDPEGNVLLIVRRPFAWINSRIFVCTPTPSSYAAVPAVAGELPQAPISVVEDQVIGETHQIWHLYRRQYEHFLNREGEMLQFGSTDAGFLAWDFVVRDEKGEVVGSINRNFAGFARELFTDTGQYVVRFEAAADELNAPALADPNSTESLPPPSGSSSPPAPNSATSSTTTEVASQPSASTTSPTSTDLVPSNAPSLGYDARAVLLATAITADIDYFSRHSGHGGGMGMGGMWMPMPGMGSSGAGAEAGEAGAVGAEGAEGEVAPRAGEGEAGEPPVVQDGGWSGSDGGGWGGWGSGGGSAGEGAGAPASGQNAYGDEVMSDPWGAQEGQEEGGTWGWGDLFPDDD